MNQQLTRPDRFFFGTRSLPCPYIAGQTERKVVTDLTGNNAEELYERLSRAGFRRSHNLAYRPACPTCNACIPARIAARNFEMTRSFRRVMTTNSDVTVDDMDAIATVEQYRLFSAYQQARHEGGDMSGMAFNDYRSMVEDTPVKSRTVEFRDDVVRWTDGERNGNVGVAVDSGMSRLELRDMLVGEAEAAVLEH